MLGTAILLQLTLWVASIHAFYPFIPEWQCEENNICSAGQKSSKSKTRDTVAYKLVQRGRKDDNANPSARASREAARLLRKHKPSRTIPSELSRRENVFRFIPPATPTTPSSAGIYQDGTDFTYMLQIGIGSAEKPMYMLLDTGAGATWLIGPDCQTKACTMHNSFGSEDSETYKSQNKDFKINYGSGVVSGTLVKDTMSVAGLDLSVTFGEASNISDIFVNYPFDGIIGMSLADGKTDNFMKVVKASKALKSNIFAVSLNRNADGANTGEITFGGLDSSKYTGDISYTSVLPGGNGDWVILMDDLAYDGKKAGVGGRNATIDTGTSYVFGPPDDVAALHKLIPGATTKDGGFSYTVPCDSTKVLSISFSGVAYTVSPKDWVSPPANEVCTSNIYGQSILDDPTQWCLGALFLKNVYSVYDADLDRVGLAASAATASTATTSQTSSTATSSKAVPTTSTAGSVTGSAFAGSGGDETSATPAEQTTGSSEAPAATAASATPSSPGHHYGSNTYASIICIVAVIIMIT